MERTPRRSNLMNNNSRYSTFSRPTSAARQAPIMAMGKYYNNDPGHQTPHNNNNFGSFDSCEQQQQNYQQIPNVFDGTTTKTKGRGLSVDLLSSSDNNGQYQGRLHNAAGGDREQMKEILADSFSRNETISILPGFKDDSKISGGKSCIKLGQSSNHTMNLTLGDKPPYAYHPWNQGQSQHQQVNHNQSRTSSSTSDPRYENSKPYNPNSNNNSHMNWDCTTNNNNDNNNSDNNAPWPYGQQKSQRSIREAQAAYKRDLDKQIEEKRQSRDKSVRKSMFNKSATSYHPPKSPEVPSSSSKKSVSQSVSLEAFRNTGFLPPWFDPIRNNPLYSVPENEGGGGGEQVQRHSERTNNVHQLQQPKYNNDSNNFKIPNDFQPTNLMTPIKFAPGSPRLQPQAATPSSGNYYIVSQEIINQLTQQQQQNLYSNMSQSLASKPRSQQQQQQTIPNITGNHVQYHQPNGLNSSSAPPQLQPQQNIWTPWLNSPKASATSITTTTTLPVSTPITVNNHGAKMRRAESPDPSTPQMLTERPEFYVKQQPQIVENNDIVNNSESNNNLNSKNTWNQSEINHNICGMSPRTSRDDENNLHENDLHSHNNESGSPRCGDDEDDGGENDSFIELTPHVSQTASQRPDEEVMKTRYKSQLAKQIEEKKRLEQEKLMRQQEEDAKFQKKIEEDQRRMAEEYEEEQRQHKIRQEEYKKRQEMILKEKQRFDAEAEEQRNKRKLERRRSRIKTPCNEQQQQQESHKGNSDNKKSGNSSIIYESPVDLTLCAASKWATEERAKSPSPPKSETSESQISITSSTLDTPRPRTVIISHHSHRASVGMKHEETEEQLGINNKNRPTSNKFQDNNDDDEDMSFLALLQRNLVAEDDRIGQILKKKERFFVTF